MGKDGVNILAKYSRSSQLFSQVRSPIRASIWLVMIALALFGFGYQAIGLQEYPTPSDRREAVVLTLNGAVTPPAADYLKREISNASDAGKELVVLEIDTPGGLISSMEEIIKAILASETPVATYVSPSGAKSASAGLYIMYAAHVSAMAPATNTGSASPITLGGAPSGPEPAEDEDQNTSEADSEDADPASEQEARNERPLTNDEALRRKMENNELARIRTLAELRGRNAEWAEKAVVEAANITEKEALELNVIDLIADDLDDLFEAIDGRTVEVASGEKTLNTKNLIVTRIEPTLVENILGFFANPNVAAILMSLGTLGLTVELWNPGSIFPGFVGVICLALGLYSLQVLPFNWLGVALIIVGILGIVLEAYTPTLGLIGIIGLLCFGAGLYLLFPAGFKASESVLITAVGIMGALLALILFALIGSRSGGAMLGGEAIHGRNGYVDDWDGLEGHVIVEGERWRARSSSPLSPGDEIKVTKVDGLVLIVRKAKGEGRLPDSNLSAEPVL